jgi:formyltetrahydrofolate deformylase
LLNHGRLIVSCTDRPGIVAAISQFLYAQGANITHSDQHSTHPTDGEFFIRVEFDLPELEVRITELEQNFAPVREQYGMTARFTLAAKPKRLAIFVSKEDHCLLELLWQRRANDLPVEFPMVISNHPDLAPIAESFGIPFHHIPVTKDTKEQAEQQQLALVEGQVDAIILARYMQIVTPGFIERWPNRIINIHHSFLPAFVGARPYQQAYDRGVKLIGATAHYVTAELDAGPIIEQDNARVDHRHDAEDLRRMGRQIERVVLARAVTWHVEDRVLVYGNKTVVFS